MKKIIVIIAISLMAIPAFSQFLMFEQDVRIPTSTEGKAILFSQIQGDAPLGNGFSMGPYFGTTYDWVECLWFINYTQGPISFGLGLGGEQVTKLSWRLSPWVKFAPTFKSDSTKSIAIFSLWEFGSGKDNYWYTNSLTYESSKISVGALARRFYGVGPIFGWKFKAGIWNIKFSGAPLYDFEESVLKPTVILTITN